MMRIADMARAACGYVHHRNRWFDLVFGVRIVGAGVRIVGAGVWGEP